MRLQQENECMESQTRILQAGNGTNLRDEKLCTTNTNTLRQVIKELCEPLKNSPTLLARIAPRTRWMCTPFFGALSWRRPAPFPILENEHEQ
jgi:hypothetical protein